MLLRVTTASALAICAICLSIPAVAQQAGTYKARLNPNGKNVGACSALDTSLAREHTVTVTGDKAAVSSAGGLKGNLKSIGPNKFESTAIQMGTVQLTVTVDLGVSPSSMSVTDRSYGCRWEGALKK